MRDAAAPSIPNARTTIVNAAFHAAPDALVVVDRHGMTVLVNEQAERAFGYERSDFLQLALEELIPERARRRHHAHRRRYGEAPRVRPMGAGSSILARRSDGSEFAAQIALSPIHAAGDRRGLTAASIRDISELIERRRADQAEIARREQAAETMIAEAARQVSIARYDSDEYRRALSHYTQLVRHRVANPLHIIQGMARTLLDQPDLHADLRTEMLMAIEDAAGRIARETIFRPDLQGPEEAILRPKPFE